MKVFVMATAQQGNNGKSDEIQPYSLHVSVKYLQLTRRKLELTRLPREIQLPEGHDWDLGTPKSALEPLIDTWLDNYSWREQEAVINQELPQFRTMLSLPITTTSPSRLRIHFVHRRSAADDAIPLLYCHGHPGSFLEVSRIIGPLTSPIPTHLHSTEDSPSFHVVAPSIPGFGFSDACELQNFGITATARVFDELMGKLGYQRYVVHGSGWGFKVARTVALNHAHRCMAVHTSKSREEPSPTAPSTHSPSPLRTYLSKLIPRYSPPQHEQTRRNSNSTPQTASYALCDSPIGLLATVLDQIHAEGQLHFWTATEILTWTMLLWLPGPEACLRWVHAAKHEEVPVQFSDVPLGVSLYQAEEEELQNAEWNVGREERKSWKLFNKTTPMPHTGLEKTHKVVWVQKMKGKVGIPAWDSASDVILHLRRFCAVGRRDGWLMEENALNPAKAGLVHMENNHAEVIGNAHDVEWGENFETQQQSGGWSNTNRWFRFNTPLLRR